MKSTHLTRRLSAPLALVMVLGLAGCGVFGGKDKPSTPTVGNRVQVAGTVTEYVPAADPYQLPLTELTPAGQAAVGAALRDSRLMA